MTSSGIGRKVWSPCSELIMDSLCLLTDFKEHFHAYRQDAADTLLNAYYVLRDAMVEQLVKTAYSQLSTLGSSTSFQVCILPCP